MKFNEENVEYIIKEYSKGKSLRDLGKEFKTRDINIRKLLTDNDVAIRKRGEQVNKENYTTNRKWFFNEDYFKEIDTSDKAYWLGFLFADGNVFIPKSKSGESKGATIELGLKAEDDYHIYNFVRCIDGNNLIEYRQVKLNNKEYPSARIQLNSAKMANDLIRKGCVPRKSLILKPPKGLSKHLTSHFIRGYFDGDGCVGFYENRNAFMLQILGTKPVLNWIQTILENKLITSRIRKDNRGDFFILDITGRDNFEAFFNYIYKDKKYFLGRKYDKYVNSLLYFDKNPNISKVSKLFAEIVC